MSARDPQSEVRMTPAEFRALIEWPVDDFTELTLCAGCLQPVGVHCENRACRIYQRNAALEAAAVQAERIEKAMAKCAAEVAVYEGTVGDRGAAWTATYLAYATVLKILRGDQS